MTEKDLYQYRDAKREEERLRVKLRTYEARIGSVRSPIGSAAPPDHSSDPTGQLVADMQRRDIIRQKLEAAIREANVAELRLDAARRHLDGETQIKVFDVLYFGYVENGRTVFPTIYEASKKIRYSQSHIYHTRRVILALLAPVSA